MEVYSTGEILKEKLQQKAQVRLPLLQKVHGEHAWMEVHRFLDDDGAECVCARLHVPNVDAVRAMRLPKGVVVKDELAFRQFLSRTPVQPTREKVLEQVMLQVVSQKGNEDLLGACPHVDLLDLAGVFYIPVKLAGGMLDGFGRLQWTDLNDLELSPEELYAAAREGDPRGEGLQADLPEREVDRHHPGEGPDAAAELLRCEQPGAQRRRGAHPGAGGAGGPGGEDGRSLLHRVHRVGRADDDPG